MVVHLPSRLYFGRSVLLAVDGPSRQPPPGGGLDDDGGCLEATHPVRGCEHSGEGLDNDDGADGSLEPHVRHVRLYKAHLNFDRGHALPLQRSPAQQGPNRGLDADCGDEPAEMPPMVHVPLPGLLQGRGGKLPSLEIVELNSTAEEPQPHRRLDPGNRRNLRHEHFPPLAPQAAPDNLTRHAERADVRAHPPHPAQTLDPRNGFPQDIKIAPSRQPHPVERLDADGGPLGCAGELPLRRGFRLYLRLVDAPTEPLYMPASQNSTEASLNGQCDLRELLLPMPREPSSQM
mmetsp:Transcript_62509/g.181235  ORF Transcript_62509/g.181235 Transcript_62509/m.181235 type:complete len:290 (+) Transcript_62509:839-1708(+)